MYLYGHSVYNFTERIYIFKCSSLIINQKSFSKVWHENKSSSAVDDLKQCFWYGSKVDKNRITNAFIDIHPFCLIHYILSLQTNYIPP